MGARKLAYVNSTPLDNLQKELSNGYKKNSMGIYEPKKSPGYMANQPSEKNAFGYCTFYQHKGYVSVKMARDHQCLQKRCPHLKPKDHSYWEHIHNTKGMRVVENICKRFEKNEIDYFEYQNIIYTAKNRNEINDIIKMNHIYSTEQLKFGTIGDELWNKNNDTKGDTNMVTFGENLKTWLIAKKMNTITLGMRSGLGETRIKSLLDNKSIPQASDVEKIVSVFDVPVATFLRGVNMNGQFETVDQDKKATDINKKTLSVEHRHVLDRYSVYPASLKRHISMIFFDWLKRKTGMTISKMCENIEYDKSTMYKYSSGVSPVSTSVLIDLEVALENENKITADEYFNMLEQLTLLYCANYNLTVAINAYPDIESSMGAVLGGTQNLLTRTINYKRIIPADICDILSSIFNVDSDVFKTAIMKKNDFWSTKEDVNKRLHEYLINKKGIIEDSVQDRVNKMYAEYEDSKKEEKSNKPVKEAVKETEPVITPISNLCDSNSLTTQDRINKMYSKLSPDHKTEIDALIEKYFWMDI